MISARSAATLLGVFCLALGLVGRAEEPRPAAARAALPAFHRTFLPADEIQNRTWTQGYLPMDAQEFERLLATVQAAVAGAPGGGSTYFENAEYAARLVGDDVLVGTLNLHLARRTQPPAAILLEPCNLALGAAAWQDRDGKPALIGAGFDGRLRVLAEGLQLTCPWSLRGERTASGAVEFRLELPDCPISRLTLDAPAASDLIADRGLVTQGAGDNPQTRRWTIELGGNPRLGLRVISPDVAGQRRPLTLVRQAVTYEFSPRGIKVDAQLKLDVHGEPLQRIAVDLDPGLRLVTARYGELEIPWSATADVETRMSHAVLQLPDPIAGMGRVLQLSAMAPLVSGKTWRLPGLRPQGMSWQEGTAELLIPSVFVLEQLATNGCRQSRITTLPAPLAGESIEIQYYRPGGTIDVLMAPSRRRLKIDTGTLVEVGMNEVTSNCAVQLSSSRGHRSAVQFDVRPGWLVDSVENARSSVPVNWELDESAPQTGMLRVRFESAITAEAPARLLIRGHRPLAGAGAFDAGQLAMLAFDPFERGVQLISVRAAEGSELQWTGTEELNRLDPLKLNPAELELFAQPPSGLIFSDDAIFAQASAVLERRKPNYTVDVRIDAAVQRNVLTETYTLRCAPESARVERLLVHLSQAREAPLEWNLAGGNSGQFSARKMSAAEQAQSGLPTGGEVWELNLQLSRPGAFELRGVRSVALSGETPLALAAVADAGTQRGTLAIRALGGSGLSIKNRRLTPVPGELLDADRFQTSRATYHYQPARDDLGPEPAVSITPAEAAQSESGAWAWNHRLDSRYASDGSSVHWAVLHLQTAGRQQLRLGLEEHAQLQAVWIDGQRLPGETASATDGVTIELPAGRSFATLSLCFTTPDGLPALTSRHEPPFPTLDIPVMARQWSVWLPPGFSILDTDDSFPCDSIVPLSWSQRLFGALGRDAGQRVFNPLVGDAWQATFGSVESPAARQAADAFLENLGTLVADYATGEGLTWGQLLSLSGETEAQVHRTLMIDADNLAWLGVSSQTRVRFPAGETAAERGQAVLRQARLVLLADPAAIVVTSASGAASFARQLSRSAGGIVHTLSPGSLADEIHGAASRAEWSRFEPVETWRATTHREPSAWLTLAAAGWNLDDAQNWTAYTYRLSEGAHPQIRIVRTSAMGSLAWVVLLSVVGAGLWRLQSRPALLVALVSASACAALVLPAAYSPLASASLLAGLLCLILRVTRALPSRARASDRSGGSRKVRSSMVQELAKLVLAGAILHLGLVASAEPPAPPLPAAATGSETKPEVAPAPAKEQDLAEPQRTIYGVLVPTDERQNPVGGKYYVPEELYRQLHRQAGEAGDQPRDWLVTRGFYNVALARDPVSHRMGVAQCKATFDFEVFQPKVFVKLPLSRQALADTITAVRLEGRTVPVSWTETGDALIVGPLAAERYRLEIDLQPAVQADATAAGFDVPIVPIANAMLDLTFPPDAPPIEVPTARGEIRLQNPRGQMTARLGPSDRLAVRWPIASGRESAAPSLEVEELIWVKVRPGTTVLDARFKFRVLAGRVGQVRLLTDPRLRLLPPTSSQSPIAAVRTQPGDPQKIDLELARGVADQVVIDLSFLVTSTSGVGNLRLPRLESTGARATKRWLAVTVDAALQPRIQAGEDSRTIDLSEFTAAWGAADARPQAAYAIPRGEPIWVLATQPNEPRIAADQLLVLSFGRSSSRVQFDSQLTIAGGHILQLRLQGPRGLVVEQVSLMEDQAQRVARWTVDEEGRVAIFFNAPVNGRQQLSLRGRWDVAPKGAFPAPQIVVEGAETRKQRLHLYRQPAVLAKVETTAPVSNGDAKEEESVDRLGANVGRYQLADPTTSVTVSLIPNVVKSRAAATTWLQRDEDRWAADLHFHLEVAEGLVDSLQFEIPPQWSEPFRIEPATPFRVVPIPGELKRHLIVYPEQSIGGKYSLKIRGRVALSAGDRLRAPDILPLRFDEMDRFVVLPQRLDLQQVTWDTIGLSRATLPAPFAALAPAAQSQAVYQVAGERFQASLKGVEQASAASQVALADMHVVWPGDDHCQGVAVFDLVPRGAAHCVLELPAECRLLHASIEHLPAVMTAIDAQRWRMTLESQQLPQRIEVIYTCPVPTSGVNRKFQAPRLAGLDVAQTLWTVYGPPGPGGGQRAKAGLDVSPAQQDFQRLRTIAGLVQLPAEAIGEHLPEEIVRWYRPWKHRYSHARAALASTRGTRRGTSGQGDDEIDARELDQQIVAVEERIGSSSPGARPVSLAPPSTELLAAARAHLVPAHYMVRGKLDDLDLGFPQSGSAGLWPRRLLGTAILLAGAAVALLMGGLPLPTFAPWLVLGGVGLAWWLLLAPSALGLAALSAAGWLALQNRRSLGAGR